MILSVVFGYRVLPLLIMANKGRRPMMSIIIIIIITWHILAPQCHTRGQHSCQDPLPGLSAPRDLGLEVGQDITHAEMFSLTLG